MQDHSSLRRKSLRLKDFDYSQPGAYFVTIVAHQRECLFAKIPWQDVAEMDTFTAIKLTAFGEAVLFTWGDLVNHVRGIELGPFVVMPNHVHGIIYIIETEDGVGAGSVPAPGLRKVTLPEIVRQVKTHSGRRINALRGTPGAPVWQRNYYEHVIRNQKELQRIADYIMDNPRRWMEDPEYRE